jgi:hypothetical protein
MPAGIWDAIRGKINDVGANSVLEGACVEHVAALEIHFEKSYFLDA